MYSNTWSRISVWVLVGPHWKLITMTWCKLKHKFPSSNCSCWYIGLISGQRAWQFPWKSINYPTIYNAIWELFSACFPAMSRWMNRPWSHSTSQEALPTLVFPTGKYHGIPLHVTFLIWQVFDRCCKHDNLQKPKIVSFKWCGFAVFNVCCKCRVWCASGLDYKYDCMLCCVKCHTRSAIWHGNICVNSLKWVLLLLPSNTTYRLMLKFTLT